MMQDFNEYTTQWKEWVEKENNALQSGDTDTAGKYAVLAQEAYDNFQKHMNTMQEWASKSFGELNHIFEENLPYVFKDNKKLLKQYTKMLKEDKNLLAQRQFFKSLSEFQKGGDAKEYVTEAFKLISDSINYNTIKESNKKLANFMANNYNKFEKVFVNEDAIKLYESCDYLFNNKKKVTNLNEINSNLNTVINYTNSNAKTITENTVNVFDMINEFDSKYGKLLNEEEKSFVQEIMAAKKQSDTMKQKRLYESIKNDCIKKINDLMETSNDTEKANLMQIKEQLTNKTFCIETLTTDVAKLLEIRDVLMS